MMMVAPPYTLFICRAFGQANYDIFENAVVSLVVYVVDVRVTDLQKRKFKAVGQ